MLDRTLAQLWKTPRAMSNELRANLNEDGDRGSRNLLPAAVTAVTVAERLLQLPQQLVDDTTQSSPACAATSKMTTHVRVHGWA